MADPFRIEIHIDVIDNTQDGVASLKNMEKALKDAEVQASKTGDAASGEFKAMDSAAQKAAQSVKKNTDALNANKQAGGQAGKAAGAGFESAGAKADQFTKRIEKSNKSLLQLAKEKIKMTIEALDKASPAIKTLWDYAKQVGGKGIQIAVRMKDMITAPFRKLYHLIASPITIALSAAGVGLGVNDIVSTYTGFTTGMSTVRAITSATTEEFQMLNQTAKELGANTVFSASQAAEGMKYLGMAGWDVNQIISAMPGLLDLAAAGQTELGTAADIVSDVMTAMKMSADQASRAADIFARTATSSNTTIEGLGNTMKYAAPIAHAFGMSLEQVSTIAGMMANSGIKGEMAGTALRSSLLRLSSPTSEMAGVMKKLGLSFQDSGGKMKDIGQIVSDLSDSFAGLSQAKQLEYAQALFGTEAASAWVGVINQGSAAYDALYRKIVNSTGAAKEMAAIQLDNLAGDTEELSGAVETMKLEIMEALDPYLRSGAQWLTAQIPSLKAAILSAIEGIVDKAGQAKEAINGLMGSADWQNAQGFGEKALLVWDRLIIKPLSNWWSQSGKAQAQDLLSGIWSDILSILSGLVRRAPQAIASLLGDALSFGPTSLFSALLLGTGAGKVGNTISALTKGISGAKGAFRDVQAAAAQGGMSLGRSLGSYGAVAGAGIGALGLISAIMDLTEATRASTEKEKRDSLWQGAAKMGMVGAGTGLGALIGSIIPGIGTLIGAGIGAGLGGLAALTAGGSVGVSISGALDGTTRLNQLAEAAVSAKEKVESSYAKAKEFEDLVEKYREVNLQLTVAVDDRSVSQLETLKEQYDGLTGKTVALTAQFNSNATSEQIEAFRTQWEKYPDDEKKQNELIANLISNTDPETIAQFRQQFSAIQDEAKTLTLKADDQFSAVCTAIQAQIDTLRADAQNIEITIQQNQEAGTEDLTQYTALAEVQKEIASLQEAANIVLSITEGEYSGNVSKMIEAALGNEVLGQFILDMTLENSDGTIAGLESQLGSLQQQMLDMAQEYCLQLGIGIENVMDLNEEKQQEILEMMRMQNQVDKAAALAQVVENREALPQYQQKIAQYAGEKEQRAAQAQQYTDLLAGIYAIQRMGEYQEAALSLWEGLFAGEETRSLLTSAGIFEEQYGDLFNGDTGAIPKAIAQAMESANQGAAASLKEQTQMENQAASTYDLALSAITGNYGGQYRGTLEELSQSAFTGSREDWLSLRAMIADIQALNTASAQEGGYGWLDYTGKMSDDAILESLKQGVTDQVVQAFAGAQLTGGTDIYSRLHDYIVGLNQAGVEGAFYRDKYNLDNTAQAAAQGTASQEQIKTAQQTLEQYGFGVGKSGADGRWGPNTQSAYDAYLGAVQEGSLSAQQFPQALDEAAGAASEFAAWLRAQVGGDASSVGALPEVSPMDASLDGLTSGAESASGKLELVSGNAGKVSQSLISASSAVSAFESRLRNADVLVHAYVNVGGGGGGDGGSAAESAAQNAQGGIYGGALLSWIAEDGPEAVIPLGAKRRRRGLELWAAAGEMLGIHAGAYAQGGILAPYGTALAQDAPGPESPGRDAPVAAAGKGAVFYVTVAPTYEVTGQDAPQIMEALSGHEHEVLEMLMGRLNEEAAQIISNPA